MTVALTTAIQVPNITRLKVTGVQLDDTASVAQVTVEARSGASNRVYGAYRLYLCNGNHTDSNTSHRMRLNPSPATFGDAIVMDAGQEIAGGYDAVEAAYRTGGNKAAAFRAVETALLALGAIDASLTGAVS